MFGASVHPDYAWRFPGHSSWSKCFSGQEEVRSKLLKPLFALFATEYRAQAINLVAEGDFVVAEVRGDVQTKRGQRYNNKICSCSNFVATRSRRWSNIAIPIWRSACSAITMTRSGDGGVDNPDGCGRVGCMPALRRPRLTWPCFTAVIRAVLTSCWLYVALPPLDAATWQGPLRASHWVCARLRTTVLTLVLFATYVGIGALAHDSHFSLGWVLG